MSDPSKSTPILSNWVWGLLWTALVGSALFLRPILPIDETRYMSVAWEMWLRGDYLVPHLNGTAYSHKPPLLFWLINAGWAIFGVNDFWPRIIAPLFGLGCLVMTSLLGRRLYPKSSAYFLAPLLLVGCYYWGLYTTLTMFDMILAFWSLVGIYGLILVWKGTRWLGWTIFGCSIGLGVLSKGPVILIFLLPSAIFGPYWATTHGTYSWHKWYTGLLGGVLLGAIIPLSWAIPAGEAGGPSYRDAILWGQSAGRVAESFAHKKPFWWYFVILPSLILPWIIWPTLLKNLWRSIIEFRSNQNRRADSNIRHLLVWLLSPLLVLSLISGKQPHYLLPLFPALALGASAMVSKLTDIEIVRGRWDLAPIAIIVILCGLIIILSPVITTAVGMPEYSGAISQLWSTPLIVSGLSLLFKPPVNVINRVISISAISFISVFTAHGLAQPRLNTAYDLKPLAQMLRKAQIEGYTVANMDKYHGQYNFLGRLTKPIVFTDSKLLAGWLRDNPKSKIVSYHYSSPEKNYPEYFQTFRGRYIAIWNGASLRKNPKIAFREN